MKVVFRHYSPNIGLEEQQANIYKKISGLSASANEIKERIKGENRDPRMIRYALTDEGKVLAYVQARDSPIRFGRTAISYPWALPECSESVKNKLFDELMTYLLQREKTKEKAREKTVLLRKKISEKIF